MPGASEIRGGAPRAQRTTDGVMIPATKLPRYPDRQARRNGFVRRSASSRKPDRICSGAKEIVHAWAGSLIEIDADGDLACSLRRIASNRLLCLGGEVTFRECGDGVGQFVRHAFNGLGVAIFRSEFQLNGVDGSAGAAAVYPDGVAAGVVWALGGSIRRVETQRSPV